MKKFILINKFALTMVACGCGSGSGKSQTTPVASSSSSVAVISSSSSSSAGSPASNWSLVWSDEFTGSAIDTTKWSFEKNCTGGGNNELQCYIDRAENATVSDGKLQIIARKETFFGQSKGDDEATYDANDISVQREYTSARLRTKNKGDWKYGRIEINAKLPQGQGVWPAIWMLPTEWKYGGWPRSGEIDIMEAINSNTGTNGNKIYGTLHYGDSWPNNKNTGTSISPATNIWMHFILMSLNGKTAKYGGM
jgi:beta-glucanase (GH16 family)